MAALVPAALLLLSWSSSALGCAFPSGACVQSVCDSLDLPALSPLLDPTKFAKATSAAPAKTDFAALPSYMGFYFSKFNTLYNGGRFDRSKKADREGAPFINYFEMRSSLGKIDEAGVSLADCCNDCASSPQCSLYLFNPYIKNVKGVKTFKPTGDCYFLLKPPEGVTWTYNRVKNVCNFTESGPSVEDGSVKALFYGGTCNGDVSDDPHFVGAHGTRFDFNGELDKAFCLLTDSRLQLNALLRGYKAPHGEASVRSWMKELGIVWVDAQGVKHALQLVARKGKAQERGSGFLAQAVLDGQPLEIPAQPGNSNSKGDMAFTFEGVGKVGHFDVDNFQLQIGDQLSLHLALRVAHPKLQTPEDAEVHFNMIFDNLKVTEKIHGVLGQTYRNTAAQQMKAVRYSALSRILGAPVQADGKTGEGFLEGQLVDYETSSVTAADCKFSSLAA